MCLCLVYAVSVGIQRRIGRWDESIFTEVLKIAVTNCGTIVLQIVSVSAQDTFPSPNPKNIEDFLGFIP